MRWLWAGCAVLAAAVASSFAQDAPPTTDQFVVKARIKGVKPEPGVLPVVIAWVDGELKPLPSKSTFDGDGALECVVTLPKPARPGRVDISFASRSQSGPQFESAHLFVFSDLLTGRLDLGEVELGEDAKPLVAGRVVNADGDPEYGAHVFVTCRPSSAQSFRFSELTATSDDTGAFSVRGVVRGGPGLKLELGLDEGATTEKPVPFTAGATDVKVVALPRASLRGTLELPEGLPFDDLVVVVKGPPGGTDGVAMPGTPRFSRGGTIDRLEFPARPSFRIDGLLPGTYDVRVRFREASRPLLRLPEVVIDTATPELPPLVVTTTPRRAMVHVVRADGSPASSATVWLRDKGDLGRYRGSRVDATGTKQIVFVADEASLAVREPETDFTLGTCEAGEVTLKLAAPASTPLTIQWPEGAPRTMEGGHLEVALSWRAPLHAPRNAVASFWDETDPRASEVIEVSVPEEGPVPATITVPGWYQVMLRIRRSNGWSGRTLDNVQVKGAAPITAPLGMTADEIAEMISSDHSGR